MITGELPFKGDYDQAVVYSIINSTAKQLPEDSTDGIQAILDRCITKEPSDRYQNVDELIEDLIRLKEGSTITRSTKVKNKVKPLLITTVILIVIVLGYLFIPLGDEEKTDLQAVQWENSIAVLLFDDLSSNGEQEYLAEAMTDQIILNLGKIKKIKVIGRKAIMKYRNVDMT
jgi:serine/threonine protein kinase